MFRHYRNERDRAGVNRVNLIRHMGDCRSRQTPCVHARCEGVPLVAARTKLPVLSLFLAYDVNISDAFCVTQISANGRASDSYLLAQ